LQTFVQAADAFVNQSATQDNVEPSLSSQRLHAHLDRLSWVHDCRSNSAATRTKNEAFGTFEGSSHLMLSC
jgi:hypothetical protein